MGESCCVFGVSGSVCRWRGNEGRDFRAARVWRKQGNRCNRRTAAASSRMMGAWSKDVGDGKREGLMESKSIAGAWFQTARAARRDHAVYTWAFVAVVLRGADLVQGR